MADARDTASLIAAGQKAAGDGDYVAAERLLCDAAAKQEASLGPAHVDLAATLNNLASVWERLEKYEEAERGYRRAHAIAVGTLSPGHPFIKTSLTNLLDFCATHGIPVWTPPAAPADDEAAVPADDEAAVPAADEAADDDLVDESSETDVEPEVEHDTPAVTQWLDTPAAIPGLPLRLSAAVLAIVAIVVVLVARQGQETSPPPVSGSVPGRVPSPAHALIPGAGPGRVPGSGPGAPHGDGLEPRPAVAPKPRPDVSKGSVTVLKAQLCEKLERRGSPDWQCAPASSALRPGTFIFYTRLLAREATRVEHRWYFGGRVHQVMRLGVPARGTAGYRTFSSNRVIRERAGDWKVELRAADGSVLHEERFVVR